MTCEMAVDHKDRWPSVLTMALWALREIPFETTSLLVFGQLAHGPLSILRDSWTGKNITPRDLKRPAADYLRDLKLNCKQHRNTLCNTLNTCSQNTSTITTNIVDTKVSIKGNRC